MTDWHIIEFINRLSYYMLGYFYCVCSIILFAAFCLLHMFLSHVKHIFYSCGLCILCTVSALFNLSIIIQHSCNVVLFAAGEAQLEIRPRGETFLRALNSHTVFTCDVANIGAQLVDIELHWFNQHGVEIVDVAAPGRLVALLSVCMFFYSFVISSSCNKLSVS